jgi:hypothetical protein
VSFKDKNNNYREVPKFKYVDLPKIVEVINEASYKNNLIFCQLMGEIKEGCISLENILLHSSGEWISKACQVLIDDKMPSRIQCVGASVTYARRISALGFWFMAAEDEIEPRTYQNYNNQGDVEYLKPAKIIKNSPLQSQPSDYNIDLLRFYISASSVPYKTEKAILDSFNGKIRTLDELDDASLKHWCDILSKKLAGVKDL